MPPKRTPKRPQAKQLDNNKPDDDHVEELIASYIPYYLDIWLKLKGRPSNKRQRTDMPTTSQQTTISPLSYDTHREITTEILQAQMERKLITQVHETVQSNTALNTKLAYGPKQIEFLLFCDELYASEEPPNRYMVTREKLLAFIVKKVIRRGIRKPTRVSLFKSNNEVDEESLQTAITNNTVLPKSKKLSYGTCNNYVSAICSLWSFQVSMNDNSNTTSPRDKLVRGLLAWVRSRDYHEARAKNLDRGMQSDTTYYTTTDQVAAIAKALYGNSDTHYKYSFRNAAAFLLAHYYLLRGHEIRDLEFADMQYMELPKVGTDGSYPSMVLVFHHGKTNHSNKKQYSASIRTKLVEICPFMVTSFHFFWRWHVNGEPFPDMNENSTWFRMKFLHGAQPKSTSTRTRTSKKGKQVAIDNSDDGSDDGNDDGNDDGSDDEDRVLSTETPIGRLTHARFLNVAFAEANLSISGKSTHVPRQGGSRMADLYGVPDSDIRRTGKWNSDVMTNSYLSPLAREFIRIMAGFKTDSLYHLPRAIEEPCSELKALVFPWADSWQEKIQSGDILEPSASALSFLKLVTCLKTTFLQDAAVMMDIIPGHPIWDREIFQTQLFQDFRAKVLVHTTKDEEPDSSLLNQLSQAVAEQMVSMKSGLKSSFASLSAKQDTTAAMVQQLLNQVNNFTSGKAPLQLSVTVNPAVGSPSTTIPSTSAAIPSTSAAIPSASAAIPSASAATPSTSASILSIPTAISSTSQRAFTNDGIPIYKMSQKVVTVETLWKEWHDGIEGLWPVKDLERDHGTKWRRNDMKWYNIRKRIIDAVEDLVQDKQLSTEEAIIRMQEMTVRKGWSLDKLGTNLQQKKFYPCEETKIRKLKEEEEMKKKA